MYDYTMKRLDGSEQSLGDYKGKVVLIVNTASHCGFASQFDGLEELYETYKDKGFAVLGFPCGQFAHQEEDDPEAIMNICKKNYGVSFPMFAKIDVNGKDAAPLYKWLKSQQGGIMNDAIKWNFTKFLVDKDGSVVKRYAPAVEPKKIEEDIVALL